MLRLATLFFVFVPFILSAQLKVIVPNGTEDLSGTDIQTIPSQTDEKRILWMVNETSETLSLHCRRTEVDVVANTTNNICWVICPAIPQQAGVTPVWTAGLGENLLTETVAPGDTIFSFDFIYGDEFQPGCSRFFVEIIDAEDGTVYTDFNIVSSQCPLSTEDLVPTVFSLAPNPADAELRLTMDNAEQGAVIQVMDVLGSVISTIPVTSGASNDLIRIPTAQMADGLYFLNLVLADRMLVSERFVVHH